MARPPKPLGILPLGDLAVYVEFSRALDLEVNEVVQRLAAAVQEKAHPAVLDVVPALGGLALHFEPGFAGDVMETAAKLVEECMKEGLPAAKELGREIEVPVCYDLELGSDLDDVAARTKLAPEEIARRHAATEHRVLMVGFAPGHAYMGGLDPRLNVPRRSTPRLVVPAGSVAIANGQTVVYPYAIPGGWRVIGRTPLVIFDASRPRPSLFAPGDRVRFAPITRDEFTSMEKL
jgi:inhibitor of KinA